MGARTAYDHQPLDSSPPHRLQNLRRVLYPRDVHESVRPAQCPGYRAGVPGVAVGELQTPKALHGTRPAHQASDLVLPGLTEKTQEALSEKPGASGDQDSQGPPPAERRRPGAGVVEDMA